jgi:hypothetical protein
MDIRIAKIKKNLEKGLSIKSLAEMRHLCMEMAKEVDEPLTFYVLASVFYDIEQHWNEKTPLMVDEAKEMEQRISDALKNVIDGIIEDRQSKQMWDDLNTLLRSFLIKEARK